MKSVQVLAVNRYAATAFLTIITPLHLPSNPLPPPRKALAPTRGGIPPVRNLCPNVSDGQKEGNVFRV
ncbi:hypothetical protein EVAR_18993_1 [Eumeta japonica]|uniref:Uncharacterized protein n=1 Tax=Eumeta variegata TaxID=151549 RepID=A0A4C1V8G7_EUMVA|nr:hypothetical protein EVAR_18993_1 [Eumeta japonica]